MLKKIILDSFKGQVFAEFEFNARINAFCGKNGTGKTTLADAWFWFIADKDYALQSNPDVRPDFMAESETSVTVIWDTGKQDVVFRKYQQDMRTKKQKEEGAPVRIANKYEINSVPKTQKDFYKELENMGIDADHILLYTHPDFLLQMKVADRRNVIFPLAGNVTDLEIAELLPDCGEARELLKQYKTDEVLAMKKSEVKRCNEQLDAIPNQIIGMEHSKTPIDTGLESRRETLEKMIAEKTEQRQSYQDKSGTEFYDSQIRKLEADKRDLYNKANTERLAKLSDAHWKVDKAHEALQKAKQNLSSLIMTGNNINDGFRRQAETKKRFEAELKQVEEEQFTTNTVCPTCGQDIPKEQIEDAKAKWTESHDKAITSLKDRIKAAETMLDGYRTEGKGLVEKKKAAEQAVKDCEAVLSDAQFEVTKYSDVIYPDVTEIDGEIAKVVEDRKETAKFAEMANALTNEINATKTELADIIRRIGQQGNNDRIDAAIAELKAKQSEYVQTKADAERILYQMQLISRRKNEVLSDIVNSHFTRVRWRLFVTQKNGEIKDDCTPMVLCNDGKYRDMTYSANTAAIQAAKLDICRGLQKYYKQDLPIWLDGAECFDEAHRLELAAMDAQLILLCVTEDERMVLK